uniref:origin recognition complex subunit 1-like n=1 Tax=Myxine glutinosa TaxID=7769 RepID=UPI00358E849D
MAPRNHVTRNLGFKTNHEKPLQTVHFPHYFEAAPLSGVLTDCGVLNFFEARAGNVCLPSGEESVMMRRYSDRRLSQRSNNVLPSRKGNDSAADLQKEQKDLCGDVVVQTGKINPQDVRLGSYILVAGFDDSKPHVAKILSLNDDGSMASVCWFARPSELPKRLLRKLNRPLHSQELFLCVDGERHQSLWSSEIDSDTILGLAQVKLLKADDPDPAADSDNVFVVCLSWDGRTISPLTAEQLSSHQLDPQAVITTPSAEPSVPQNGTNAMNQHGRAKDSKPTQVHRRRLTTEEMISMIFEEEPMVTVTNKSSKRGKVSSGHSIKIATRSLSLRKCNNHRDKPLPSPRTLKISRTTRENTKNVSIAQDCKAPIHKNDSPWCLRSASRLLAKSNGTAKTQPTVSRTSKRNKILEESISEDIAESDEDYEEEEENDIKEDDDDDDEEEELEAVKPRRSHRHIPKGRVSQGKGRTIISPSMPCRSRPALSSPGVLEDARGRLCVSAVPDSLPCREEEFHHLYSFISSKLDDGTGGCMYVSGVPGTGKTATVCEVVRVLREGVCQGDVPEFRFVELNGLRLTEPRHAFSHVLKVLTGRKATPEHAASLLDEMFTQRGNHHEATLLLVDEPDFKID